MKVIHIISGLNRGGAESILFSLVSSSSLSNHTIISMTDEGIYGAKLRNCGANVHALGMTKGFNSLGSLYRLYRLIKKNNPDVVQTWMYHADFIGGIIAKLAGVQSVVWGIHSTRLDLNFRSLPTVFISLINGVLSHWLPSAIVCCSKTSAQVHQSKLYRADRFEVIPNGYDLAVLKPNIKLRQSLRDKWEVPANENLLGSIARWHPMKDHKSLFKSLVIMKKNGLFLRCALVGDGMIEKNGELMQLINDFDIQSNIILLGPRDDIPAVMNAIDINVLSSYVEAFPNVVAEAMACGTPCVVTDVGDTALIAGDTGWVVPPRDSTKLAEGITEALKTVEREGKETIGLKCRNRIANNFSVEIMLKNYKNLWERVVIQ